MPADGFGIGHLEPDQPAGRSFELLLLEGRLTGEGRALLQLHDEIESRLDRCGRVIDVIAVERQTGLEAQSVPRTQSGGRGAPLTRQRVPELLGVLCAAIQLEAVLSRVSGAGDEALHARD